MLKLLEGIKVIDFTTTISGPFCGQLLADYGATVIKVERPKTGEDARHFPPQINGVSPGFTGLQRGKKHIGLALGTPEGQEIFRKLAAKCDVILENFTPGTMKKWNIDFETIKKINPKIVYCSISAFGQFGPMAEMPGYDAVIQALSGMMNGTGFPDGLPTRTGNAATDYSAGTVGAFAIAMGLFKVAKTGEAIYLDVSMLDCAIAILDSHFIHAANENKVQPRYGNRLPYVTPFDTFETQDGWVIIATANNNTFGALCNIMNQPELLEDPRFQDNLHRCQHVDELKPIITAWSKQFPSAKLLDMMMKAGVPCAPIQNMIQTLSMPQVIARGMVQEVTHTTGVKVKIPGVTIKINGEVATLPQTAGDTAPGQHNKDILGGLVGLTDAQLAAYKEKGII
jgi:CoA:oxalate CoA-transferase